MDKYPKPGPQLDPALVLRLSAFPRAPKALQPRVTPGQPTTAWALRGQPPQRRPKRKPSAG